MKTNFRRALCMAVLAAGLVTGGGFLEEVAAGPPELTFSTYLGGDLNEFGEVVLYDFLGALQVAGRTSSEDFPLFNNPPPVSVFFWFRTDVFLARLRPGALLSSALLGMPGGVGQIDMSLLGPTRYLGGTVVDTETSAGFVAVSSVFGSAFAVHYLPYLQPFEIAPDQWDFTSAAGRAIEVGPLNSLYAVGKASYFDEDTGFHDFVVAMKLDGSLAPVWITPIEGLGEPTALAVDREGGAYVVGDTSSSTIVTTPGAFQPSRSGGQDGFVLKLSPSGAVEYLTYLGGSGMDMPRDVAVNAAGEAVVVGQTGSADFPLRDPLQPGLRGGSDLFVTRLAPDGSALLFSTFLGGSGEDNGAAVKLRPGDSIVVTGTTQSPDYPQLHPIARPCAPTPRLCGATDALVTEVAADGGALLFSVLLGGSEDDQAESLAVNGFGQVAVTGGTGSPDFPLVAPIQAALNGPTDAFVAELTLPPNQPPVCSAAAASPGVIWPPNGRLVPVAITGVTDPEGGPVTLTVTAITQDEPLSGRGPDATGIGTPSAQVRADRRGGGDGRVYRLAFEARDELGATCTGVVTVCVPRDRRPGGGCVAGDSTVASQGSPR